MVQPTAPDPYSYNQPVAPPPSRSELHALETEKALPWVGRIIGYFLWIWLVSVDVLLLLRVIMLALGANPAVPFARFVYLTTADMMAPFRGLFPPHPFTTTGYLDGSALFAILIYTLIAFLIGWLVDVMGWKLRDIRARLGEPTAYT